MKIEETERLTYHITSEKDPNKFYRVDLEELKGNGECSCEDFSCRKLPMLKQTGKIVMYGSPGATRCKHIHEALAFLGSMAIDRMNGRT